MAFCDNLKKLREAQGLSQAELANDCAIAQPTLAQYERGMKLPTIVVAVDIASRLGTTCEKMVKG